MTWGLTGLAGPQLGGDTRAGAAMTFHDTTGEAPGLASWRFEDRICPRRTKARTTSTPVSTALGEFRTDAAMTAPCSVKAISTSSMVS